MYTQALRSLTLPARSLRTCPGRYLLGPSGARLSADVLDPVPGFRGRLDLIHKMNIPLLYCVEACPDAPVPMQAVWKPHVLSQRYEDDALSFREEKWITWKDQAVSWQVWENLGDTPLRLRLRLPEDAPRNEQGAYAFPVCIHGLQPVMCFAARESWPEGCITLAPGERRELLLAAAVGLPGEEAKLRRGLDGLMGQPPAALLSSQEAAYGRWFDDAPAFTCSDRLLERCWWYRWYILRANLAQPDAGLFRHRVIWEGRSHRMDKTPYQSRGWEFSRLIPLSTPLQALDGRWSRDRATFRDALRSLCDSAGESGAFLVTATDERTKEYAQYGAWALYQYVLCEGDTAFAREVLPFFKRDVEAVLTGHRNDRDLLQIETTHALTGKEYQPGYWYFGGYPDKVRGTKEGYTPLKRVDRSVYTYLNLQGLARLCALTGDSDESRYAALARELREQILLLMWDGEDQCFYDLHAETEEKARVRHITCFDPYFAEITGDRELPGLRKMLEPGLFDLGSGLASTAADCPVFSPSGGWKGDYFKGRDGCMWDGPSWPYTTCSALDGLARQSKRHGHVYDGDFARLLRSYTLEHFRFHDPEQPYLVEFYNSRTGEALSDEPDYCHSYWIELIVRHMAGIEPTEEGFGFAPVTPFVRSFTLERLPLRGHSLDVTYARGEGFTLRLDGQTLYRGDGAEPQFFALPLEH